MRSESERPRYITKKAVAVGLLMVVVNAYWVGLASELWYAVYTLVSPFSNAVFTLVVLLGLNAGLRRFAPRAALTSAELLLVYVMVTMVSTISGHAMMAILTGALAHPFWFASPENQYAQLFHRFIPDWMTVRDPELLRGYFEGESSVLSMELLRVWTGPVLIWSGFILALYGSLLGFSLLFRKQWSEREKLSFPLTQLPLQMTTNENFWKTRGLWAGIALAGSIRLINGVHDIFPAFPGFPASIRVDGYFTERPWNAIGYTSLSFNMAIVGLAYFMPLDLAFSCWFFFWLTRAERVLAAAMGWQNLHLNDRAAGAWIGIAFIALWSARRHLAEVARHIAGKARGQDANEPLSYRATAALTLGCLAVVFLFCAAAGMSLWALAVWYALFFAFALALGHVRAGLGPPYHEVIGMSPRQIMTDLFGSRRLGGQNLTALSMLYAFNRCNRSHPMPNQVESLRVGERGGIPGRALVWMMVAAIGVGAVATFASYLQFAYQHGALAKSRGHFGRFGWEVYNPLQRLIQSPTDPDLTAGAYMGGGFLFVAFLHAMRTQFLWWPLHASGYVLSGASWGGMVYFWFPVMASWFLKMTILKFSGLAAYRRWQPFFLGLVLGDFIPRSVLSILSFALNLYMPSSGAGHTL